MTTLGSFIERFAAFFQEPSRRETLRRLSRRGSREAADELLAELEAEALTELAALARHFPDAPAATDADGWRHFYRRAEGDQGAFDTLVAEALPLRDFPRFVIAGKRLNFVALVRSAIESGQDPFAVALGELAGIPLSALRAARASEIGARTAEFRIFKGKKTGRPPRLSDEALAYAKDKARERFSRNPKTYSPAGLATALALTLREKYGVAISAGTLAKDLPTKKMLLAEHNAKSAAPPKKD